MQCNLLISEVFQAYYDCRKTKRNTWNALEFEQNLERNLMDLYYELKSGEYTPGRSIMFVITKPKAREVWAASFKDRVVHHILYNRYSERFYRRFIYDSYACIPEKGTLRASNRVQYFIRAATKNHTQNAWFLKADIANFFVSINKLTLDKLLSKYITDPWGLMLTRIVLHKDPKENVYIKSNKTLLGKVPPHKSLLNAPDGFGLPIGNLSSQFFANVYLNELDQYAKHELKLKYYARYVDDIIVIGQDGGELNVAYEKMATFVSNNLGIKFHPNKKEINRVDVGINFVGYIIKPWSKYIRRSTINNMYKKTDLTSDFIPLRATVNSYFGMLRHVNAYKERKLAALKLSQRGCWFDGRLTKLVKLGAPLCTSVSQK
jgi:retron-type reverse transcriptase